MSSVSFVCNYRLDPASFNQIFNAVSTASDTGQAALNDINRLLANPGYTFRLNDSNATVDQARGVMTSDALKLYFRQAVYPNFNPVLRATLSLNGFVVQDNQITWHIDQREDESLKIEMDMRSSLIDTESPTRAPHIISSTSCFTKRGDDIEVRSTVNCPNNIAFEVHDWLQEGVTNEALPIRLVRDSFKLYSPEITPRLLLSDYRNIASFWKNHFATRNIIVRLHAFCDSGEIAWGQLREECLDIMVAEIKAGRDPFDSLTHASNRVLLDLLLLSINQQDFQLEAADAVSEEDKLRVNLVAIARNEDLGFLDDTYKNSGIKSFVKKFSSPEKSQSVKQIVALRKTELASGAVTAAFARIKENLLEDLKQRHWGITWFFGWLPRVGTGERALRKALEAETTDAQQLMSTLNILQDRLVNSSSSKRAYYASVMNDIAEAVPAAQTVEVKAE